MSEAIWCLLLTRQTTPTEFFRQLLGGAALPQSNTLTIQLKFKTKHFLPVHTLWLMTIILVLSCFIFITVSIDMQVYKSISSQFAVAKENAMSNPSTSDRSSDLKQLTTSMVLRHVDVADQVECCICLERRPDMLLPCAHAYCRLCIDQW